MAKTPRWRASSRRVILVNMTRKEAILRAIEQLPDDATIADAQYQLYVLQKIQEGEEDAGAGRTVPHEDVMRELAEWLD